MISARSSLTWGRMITSQIFIVFPYASFQQSTKLRNRHAAFWDSFVNCCQTRINQVSDGVNRSLVVFVIMQSYCCHLTNCCFRHKSNNYFWNPLMFLQKHKLKQKFQPNLKFSIWIWLILWIYNDENTAFSAVISNVTFRPKTNTLLSSKCPAGKLKQTG